MRKYNWFFMMLLLVTMTFTGCQNASDVEEKDSDATLEYEETQNDKLEVETEISEDVTEIESSVPKLDEETLEWLGTYFFNNEEDYMANMFLTSQYNAPENVNLYDLFYGGVYGESKEYASQEERDLLEETYDLDLTMDVSKVSADTMDVILQQYLGLTLEETNKVGLDNLYYLEEYDAYYNVAGDSNLMFYILDYGRENADGSISVEYYADPQYGGDGTVYQVTLKEEEGDYHFVSNISVK